MRIRKLLRLTTMLIIVGHSARVKSESLPLDVGCKAVNDAYVTTRTTPTYSETIYSRKPDGSLELKQRIIVTGDLAYWSDYDAINWETTSRSDWSLFDGNGPKFTQCAHLQDEPSAEGVLQHFSVVWHKGDFIVPSEVSIFEKNGRFAKFLRDYEHVPWQFPFPVAVEIFDYDAAHAVSPVR